MKIVFFGTPRFAAEILDFLVQSGIEIVAVVSKPDKSVGRSRELKPTPVKLIAEKHGIVVFQPEKASEPAFAETLRPFGADLFVVVAYGEIIKENLLQMPRLCCINVHGSLLPKYRGAAPIHRSIIAGETVTGVTIMHMAKKMDVGAMILQREVPIGPNMSAGELTEVMCKTGQEALLEVIQMAERGPLPEIEQDHTLATFAPKMTLEEAEVCWDRPAEELHNLIRGTTPAPGAWTVVLVRNQKRRMKLLSTRTSERSGKPGEIVGYGTEGFFVGCQEGALQLLEVQLEGKKKMDAEAFMRGISQGDISFV